MAVVVKHCVSRFFTLPILDQIMSSETLAVFKHTTQCYIFDIRNRETFALPKSIV
jgi:hypothetical protein